MGKAGEFLEEKYIHVGDIRVFGPRRTSDYLVRRIFRDALKRTREARERDDAAKGRFASASSAEDVGGGVFVSDAKDNSNGPRPGTAADAQDPRVPVSTFLESLRLTVAALHAIPAVSECRVIAAPDDDQGLHHAHHQDQGHDHDDAPHYADVLERVGADVWIEDKVKRRFGAGVEGSPGSHAAGASAWASLGAAHLAGLGDELSCRTSWGIAGRNKERQLNVKWTFPDMPRAFKVAGSDNSKGKDTVEIAPRGKKTLAVYIDNEQRGFGASWRAPRAGASFTIESASSAESEPGEAAMLPLAGVRDALDELKMDHSVAFTAEGRDLIADPWAPLRVADDTGVSTKFSVAHTATWGAVWPQPHTLFPRHGFKGQVKTEIAAGTVPFLRHEGNAKLFAPLKFLLSTVSVGAKWGVSLPVSIPGLQNAGSKRVSVIDKVDMDLPGHKLRGIGPRARRVGSKSDLESIGSGLAAAFDVRCLVPIPSPLLLGSGVYLQAYASAGNGVALESGSVADSIASFAKGLRATAGLGLVKSNIAQGANFAVNVNFPVRVSPNDEFINFQAAFEANDF